MSHQAHALAGVAAVAKRLRQFAALAGVRSGRGGAFIFQADGNVNILKNLARSDADDSIGRLDQVIALASGVLPSEGIDEAEAGTELLGFDQEACAVRLPFHWFHGALTRAQFSRCSVIATFPYFILSGRAGGL